MRHLVTFAVVSGLVLQYGHPGVSAQQPSENLGRKLFDDLSILPADGEQDRPSQGKTPLPTRRWPDALGEDVGVPESSKLYRVELGMRTASALIKDQESFGQTEQIQEQVVVDLTSVIEQLEKSQCAACQQSGSQSSQKAAVQKQSQSAAPSEAAASATQGRSPAPDSASRLGTAGSTLTNPGDVRELIKRAWGHLPPRTREELLQAPADKFLPKYELEIEAYFRRLAEPNDS
jgi:hypothetical protein